MGKMKGEGRRAKEGRSGRGSLNGELAPAQDGPPVLAQSARLYFVLKRGLYAPFSGQMCRKSGSILSGHWYIAPSLTIV